MSFMSIMFVYFFQLSDQLNDKLREYFSVVESVSKDAIQQSVSRQSAQNIQPQPQPVLMMES